MLSPHLHSDRDHLGEGSPTPTGFIHCFLLCAPAGPGVTSPSCSPDHSEVFLVWLHVLETGGQTQVPTVFRHILGALTFVQFRAHSNTTSNLWMRHLKLGSHLLGDATRGWEARILASASLSANPTRLIHTQNKSAEPSAPKVFYARCAWECTCVCKLLSWNHPPHLQWAHLHGGRGPAFFVLILQNQPSSLTPCIL